ncbi:MAG: acyl-CoA dehydrogenase C-terminal domain-containing protein [Alphaproteobacteria bacterium]|nr:acyl-CoA dehydrogenase C-terminal domain-containing protein [Alphaproteobacteria bacterium]
MPTYKAPLEDIRFILSDVVDTSSLPGMTEAATSPVLNRAAEFCEKVLFPLNASGDIEGCHFESGRITAPKGFVEAYREFREGGWSGMSCAKECGGQGFPLLLEFVVGEMIGSANMAFSLYPMLSHAAYKTIEKYADENLKRAYLPKLVDGSWTGTMCMTEPQAGSDLGLIEAKAEPQPDGSYKITGEKIFITAGEHDLCDNIVHLVLARLPNALPGVRGISLFLVPKIFPESGARNSVICEKLEDTMGIRASAVCSLKFDGATGWLIGEPGRGVRAMFTMVNETRMMVGLQGIGMAEVAYQNAAAYAKKRHQMRAITGTKKPGAPADPIIVHPDVRQKLLTMKSLVEGCRALAIWVGREFDVSIRGADPKKKAAATDFVALMIPIIKAFGTDMGFDAANAALQIFGGHGYMRDNGIEQFVRDVRVAQIYEGTNGIQALDLVMRKMTEDYGRLLRTFFHPVARFLAEEKDNKSLAGFRAAFLSAFNKLQMASLYINTRMPANTDEAGTGAADYLRIFAYVAIGFLWLKMAKAAASKIAQGGERAAFYEAKLKTADFYFSRILPQVHGHYRALITGAKPIMDFPAEAF